MNTATEKTSAVRGEICGLRWADIDLDRAQAVISQAIAEVDGDLIPGDTKTYRSRPVGLDTTLIEMLRRHRAEQNSWRLQVGRYWQDLDLVFPAPDGSYLRPSTLTQQFDRLVAAAGISRIRLHDLRHTHATLLVASGSDAKLVSERLGHATVAFTMDRYVHPSTEQQTAAANDFPARIARA